jgi:hypothetical protein
LSCTMNKCVYTCMLTTTIKSTEVPATLGSLMYPGNPNNRAKPPAPLPDVS